MNRRFVAGVVVIFVLVLAACASEQRITDAGMNVIAERYVRLQLAIGVHDPDHIGWYYGPAQWRKHAQSESPSIAELRRTAEELLDELKALNTSGADSFTQRRYAFLVAHLQAAHFRLGQISGEKVSFDAETQRLFGIVPDLRPLNSYDTVLDRIDALLSGQGTLPERVEAFRNQFAIPGDRIDAVMRAAIEECRRRTAARIALPATDAFSLELVHDKGWSGNNLYHGDARGTIQFNTDFPMIMDRVVELACHESYPGHHTHVALLDERLVKQRGWIEYSIVPLFGPIGFIAEGEASYAFGLAFSPEELAHFETSQLYPLARLDPADAPKLRILHELLGQLPGARLTIGRMFLDGQIDRDRALQLLERYQLVSPAFAEQILTFVSRYRSYIVNYGLGERAVRAYIAAFGDSEAARWRALERIISEPTLPADLELRP